MKSPAVGRKYFAEKDVARRRLRLSAAGEVCRCIPIHASTHDHHRRTIKSRPGTIHPRCHGIAGFFSACRDSTFKRGLAEMNLATSLISFMFAVRSCGGPKVSPLSLPMAQHGPAKYRALPSPLLVKPLPPPYALLGGLPQPGVRMSQALVLDMQLASYGARYAWADALTRRSGSARALNGCRLLGLIQRRNGICDVCCCCGRSIMRWHMHMWGD